MIYRRTYFEELLNVESDVQNESDDVETKSEESKQDVCPTEGEVEKAVESLKAFKAAGPDGIVAEVLKGGGKPVAK